MDALATPRSAPRSPPSSTPMTDFASLESHKENIRPLAGGRSAAALSTLFDNSEASKILEEGHNQHRANIKEAERRDAEGEEMMEGFTDVLDVYSRYIAFTVQHHPSSTTHLLPLLESTVRRFVKDERYTQDIRHLKLWVMYSRHVERREEIWAFLESNDIGTRHAEFYEEWAIAAESLRRKKKADEVYRLGIARKAVPLERLKSRHQAFLIRIMAPPSGEVPDDDPPSAPSRTSRSVLGQVGGLSGASTTPAAKSSSSKGPNGAKLEIYSDADGQVDENGHGEWADFGTRDGRRKENMTEATPWSGKTLPQKRMAPRTPKLEVFKDATSNEAVRPADEVFSRLRAPPPSEADMLKYDPLRNFDTSQASTTTIIPTLPPPPSARKAPRPKSTHHVKVQWACPTEGPEVKDAKGHTQRRMFDWASTFKNEEEWSFQEVRARQSGLLGKEWGGEVKDWERQWHMPGSSTPKKEEKKKKMPSPTVNTKLANEEVAMMFDQTIHGTRRRVSDSDSEDSSDEDEDEQEEPVAIPPTPHPNPAAMMRPVAGLVPPTPTPAQGLGRSGPLTVFSDENAMVPPSTGKKFNIFSETPAKTPLASRTPLASSSSSKPFAIFSDENAVDATPSVKSRQPLGALFATPILAEKMPERPTLAFTIPEEPEEEEEQVVEAAAAAPAPIESPLRPAAVQQSHARVNIFATPALSQKTLPRRMLSNIVQEEDEEEEEEDDRKVDGQAGQVVQEEYVNINDEDDEGWRRPRIMGKNGIEIMTPITERTYDFTQMSALRESQTAASRRISVASAAGTIAEEGDEAFVASQPVVAATGLSAVEEEDEPSSSSRMTQALARVSLDSSNFDSPSGHRSGSMTTGFHLPEGYTIHAKGEAADAHTMMVIDGPTMGMSEREPSPEPEVGNQSESDAFVTAQHGSRLTNPCNPMDDDVVAELLDSVDPPLATLSHFEDYRSNSIHRLDALEKHINNKVRRNSTAGSRASIAPEPGFMLDLGRKDFEIREKIGEGGYGAVFLGIDIAARQVLDDADSDDEDEDEEAEDKCRVAIKVEKPASVWEAVILDRVHRRIDENMRSSIVNARKLYAFQDESYLLLDFSSQGTLLDVVNKATSMGVAPATAGGPSVVDEIVAIFFTIELLRIVENLHRANFIHGDLKIDNCMVRLEDLPNSAWSTQYSRTGSDGWSHKGVKLIDFGRGIDLSLFPNNGEGQQFVADWKVDQRDCVEMREGRPWSYQTDYFGLASICYCLLFGKYIGTEQASDSERYKIDQPLKRYWQADLWNPLFDLLLNPTTVKPDGTLPISDELAEVRHKFEDWLEENCQKGGKSLRAMLKKIELAAITARRV